MNACKSIDRHIAEYLKKNGYTQQVLADELSMSTNTLRWKRRGDTDWTWTEVQKLGELLDMSIDELTGKSA